MNKHLLDIDEQALLAARAKFGSKTIKETVNSALRQAGDEYRQTMKRRLDQLAGADLSAREQAWRPISKHFKLTVELPLKAVVRGYSFAAVLGPAGRRAPTP